MDQGDLAIRQQPVAHGARWRVGSSILLGGCCLLLVYAVVAGLWMQPTYKQLGPEGLFGEQGTLGQAAFWVWLFSLPTAVVLGIAGASMAAHARARRAWGLACAGVIVLLIPIFGGAILGRSVPPIFGAGGVLIEVFLLASIWYWAKERATLTGRLGLAADLRVASTMFFAFASWFICGIGAMPVLALYPEKMIQFEMGPLAVDMMYGILFYLVLGWALIAASQYLAAESRDGRALA